MKPVLWVAMSLLLVGITSFNTVAAEENGGIISGRVSWHGKDQPSAIISNAIDPIVCGKEIKVQAIEVDGKTRGLQHVVVSIENILPQSHTLPSRKIIVRNIECRFWPPVDAAQLGNNVEVQNQDPILHNTHISLENRTVLNVAQLANSRPIRKPLKRPGLYSIRCDKHKFMVGALMVYDHPYFAVTDAEGRFQLPRLVAGTYNIQAWHEMLGTLSHEVVVPAEGTVDIHFAYP